MERRALGHSLVDRRITEALTTLWEGPLSPGALESIEIGLRALFVSTTLSLSRVDNPWDSGNHETQPFPKDLEEPFSDHLLDYEFQDVFSRVPQAPLAQEETRYLESLISENLSNLAESVLPRWIELEGQALAYLDAWYQGYDEQQCANLARERVNWESHTKKYIRDDFTHAVFHKGPQGDAKYLVSIFRAGVDIYSNAPVAKLSKEFIFSKWPNRVFESFDKDYRATMREIRGPACAIDLPPLTALVLSRAAHRDLIPETIRDIRDEYKEDRRQLWRLLAGMWEAEPVREQVEILRSLSDATKSIFRAAFPERYDALSLGLDFAQLTPGGLASGLKQLRERDAPRTKVKALSFAHKLSKDFRRHLLSSRQVLKRHLTLAEYHDFGLG